MVYAQFNNNAIIKGSGTKGFARAIKTFEYKNTRSGITCCDLWEKKNIDKSSRYTKASGGFSNTVVPDIDYFTDGPVVQYDVKNIFRDYYT